VATLRALTAACTLVLATAACRSTPEQQAEPAADTQEALPGTSAPVAFDEGGDDVAGSDLEHAIDDTFGFLPEERVIIPYVLYSDLFEAGVGAAFAFPNWPHDEAVTAGFGIVSTNGSVALALVGSDWDSGIHDRVLLDPLVSVGTYGDQRIYTGTSPGWRGERSGEHDSDEDNYREGDGEDLHFRLRFEYVLPIGSGKDHVRAQPELEGGFLVGNPAGGDTWNPFETGRTLLQLEPFYRNQSADTDRDDVKLRSNGFKVGLEYDNTDFRSNPSTGSRQRVAVSRDFDWFDSSGAWTSMEGQLSQYFDLGQTEEIAHQVLAFDVWGAHAFTWRTREGRNGTILERAPPNFEGARLGGLFRLRAYPGARFSDQSALHYTAEYRVTPRVNPLDSIPLLREIGADWTQFVIFGEIGRVHEGFDLHDLHTDMKKDAGFGIRLFVQGVVIRVDTAFSSEGAGVQVMIAQPF
jgi:hypothetical protein